MRLLRFGRRPHDLGGSLWEAGIAGRFVVTWAIGYDYEEDIESQFTTNALVIFQHKGDGVAFGFTASSGVRLYLGVGTLEITRGNFADIYDDPLPADIYDIGPRRVFVEANGDERERGEP